MWIKEFLLLENGSALEQLVCEYSKVQVVSMRAAQSSPHLLKHAAATHK